MDKMVEDQRFMDRALAQAALAAEMGEVPVGAVVVHEGKVIAQAHNRREVDSAPTAHADDIGGSSNALESEIRGDPTRSTDVIAVACYLGLGSTVCAFFIDCKICIHSVAG